MEKVDEEHILTKCSNCNNFQVLVHDFRNFNALKMISKIKKKIIKKDQGLILTKGNVWPSTHTQESNPCNS